jgi:4-amino-4-deoxy-L-arabinose transferase-like glycosyltransferase
VLSKLLSKKYLVSSQEWVRQKWQGFASLGSGRGFDFSVLREQKWISDLLSLTMLFLIFYTCWLGAYPLFTPDEGRYSEVAREMVASGDYITPRVNGVAFLDKPILYYWLQAMSIHLFGINEWALRLFPVLFGILGCAVTYICGRQLFDRRTGLLSAIILGLTPLYFVGTHYANLDLEVAVLISCTLLFFITAIQGQTSSRPYFLFLSYLFAALAFLSKGLIGIAFPAMIAGAWILTLSRWKLLADIHLAKGLALFAVIVFPWYALVQIANPEFLHYFFVTQQVTRFLSAGEFNNPSPVWFYLPIVLLGFLPWTSFLLQALKNHIRNIWQAKQSHQTELFLMLWLSIVFIFFSIPHSKVITYILPVYPALALLTGRYLSLVWDKEKEKEKAKDMAVEKQAYINACSFMVINILFAFALVCLLHYQWIDLSTEFTPYLVTIVFIYAISAGIAGFALLFSQRFPLLAPCSSLMKSLFIIAATCSAGLLLTLTMGAKHLNHNSAKPLVLELKKIIQPQDEVIHYFKFYQDVPLYLERRVMLAANWDSPDIARNDNWMRELWYGMPLQNTENILINEKQFWQHWYSNKRVFVFLNRNYLSQFKKQIGACYFLGRQNDIFLVSNKPAAFTGNMISIVSARNISEANDIMRA